MDKKNKILLWVLALLIIASVGATYWRIMIKKDYVIEAQIDCDPYEEKCFVWECDPDSTEEGEACTGDEENDIWYFAVARRNAANIPLCDPETDESCDPWTCVEPYGDGIWGEKDCEKILCDEVTKEEQGVECNDPIQYTIDNPIEDEEVECEEGDEECLAVEESACEEDDEECLAAEGEEVVCEDGDEECLAEEEELIECDPEIEDCLSDETFLDEGEIEE
ncbi:MAG: hypothetical protein US70_C0009G0030 [Parcubacteria group bacterium GW2011_GWD2_38_11]|nr:MAG: hypothetical protein US70_C0009G0030 [Parcubacteria group bacterium GW2011_GWD2_38_11]